MKLIEARSPADAWIQASQVLLKEGNNLGDINEILNLVIEIDPRLSFDMLTSLRNVGRELTVFKNSNKRIEYGRS